MGKSSTKKEKRLNKESEEDTKWNKFVEDTDAYIEVAGLSKRLNKVIGMNLALGNEEPEERPATMKSIRNLLKNRKGTPFRRGLNSKIPPHVRIAIDDMCEQATEHYITFFNSAKFYRYVFRKHKKSGGGYYSDAGEYAKVMVKRLKDNLMELYEKEEWDGKPF